MRSQKPPRRQDCRQSSAARARDPAAPLRHRRNRGRPAKPPRRRSSRPRAARPARDRRARTRRPRGRPGCRAPRRCCSWRAWWTRPPCRCPRTGSRPRGSLHRARPRSPRPGRRASSGPWPSPGLREPRRTEPHPCRCRRYRFQSGSAWRSFEVNRAPRVGQMNRGVYRGIDGTVLRRNCLKD